MKKLIGLVIALALIPAAQAECYKQKDSLIESTYIHGRLVHKARVFAYRKICKITKDNKHVVATIK